MGWVTDLIPGICDRCGQRYLLTELRSLDILGIANNVLVCSECWESSHPQLDTRHVRTDDKQNVENSRSDVPEQSTSRALTGSWDDLMDDWK